ncbi:MAG: Crp/Fnr family transcriptional regulator [Acidobacteria bacterium]|nr:Crp/Fnr family transcriptional regulator [Acidobacteriota bacterium]
MAALPHAEFERLLPYMKVVHSRQGKSIYEPGDRVDNLYFPNDGMLSLLSVNQDGTTIEIGMVGNEGVVGLSYILQLKTTPYEVMTQLPSTMIKIKGEFVTAEFKRDGMLNSLLLRYMHLLLTQISQSVVCNRFHPIEKRLCRWLLTASYRLKTDTLHLTQEIIGHMLGVPRTGVTMAAVSLQRAGLIRYSRGKIEFVDRKAIEAASCECYQIVIEEMERFLDI